MATAVKSLLHMSQQADEMRRTLLEMRNALTEQGESELAAEARKLSWGLDTLAENLAQKGGV